MLLLLFNLAIVFAANFSLTPIEKNLILNVHNQERSLVCLPQLTWDDSLANSSQTYAQQCRMRHSGTSGVGENLWGGSLPWARPINSVYTWVSEKNEWTCGFCCNESTGHYTQIVSNDSQRVGCGAEVCQYGDFQLVWIVCQYSPPGNGRPSPFPVMNCYNNGICDSNSTSTIDSTTSIDSTTYIDTTIDSTIIDSTTSIDSTTIDSTTYKDTSIDSTTYIDTSIDSTGIDSTSYINTTTIVLTELSDSTGTIVPTTLKDTTLIGSTVSSDDSLPIWAQILIGLAIYCGGFFLLLCVLYCAVITKLKGGIKVTDDIIAKTEEDDIEKSEDFIDDMELIRFNSAKTVKDDS